MSIDSRRSGGRQLITERRSRNAVGHLRHLIVSDAEVAKALDRLPAHNGVQRDVLALLQLGDTRPLGYAELEVLEGLVGMAAEQGELRDHSWASSSHPPSTDPETDRVRVEFAGYSDLAHRLGYDAGGSTRRRLRKALDKLVSTQRLVAYRVRDRSSGKEDVEVAVTPYVQVTVRLVQGRGTLHLHPIVVQAFHRAFVEARPPGVRWAQGRERIGAREMRESFARADYYLMLLAFSEAGRDKILRRETLIERLLLGAAAANQGAKWADDRISEALEFCVGTGRISAWGRDHDDFRVTLTPITAAPVVGRSAPVVGETAPVVGTPNLQVLVG